MKKVILAIFTALTSTAIFAEDLQCEKNYEVFKRIYQGQVKNMENGDTEAFKENLQKNEYDRLFKNKHPGQTYFAGNWSTNEKYNQDIESSFKFLHVEGYKNVSFEFSKPKVNFISSIGEICVVPITSEDVYSGNKEINKSDTVFIRNLKNNEWRQFTYIGIEEKKDMDEFFGQYTSALKLDPALANGKNFADKTLDISLSMFKYLGLEATPEIINELKEKMKPYRDRLKANGH